MMKTNIACRKATHVCAENLSRKQLLKEAHMQEHALKELIKWRNTLALIVIFCVILCYCAFSGTLVPFAVGIVSAVAAGLCTVAALVIHRSICHGEKNVAKIKKIADKD